MKNGQRYDIITCPECGAEYTAGEIYIPNSFLGVPKDLEKDVISHKIIYDGGKQMNTHEKYICDYCNTPFIVKSVVKFYTQVDEKANINKDYVTKLTKTKLYLKEE